MSRSMRASIVAAMLISVYTSCAHRSDVDNTIASTPAAIPDSGQIVPNAAFVRRAEALKNLLSANERSVTPRVFGERAFAERAAGDSLIALGSRLAVFKGDASLTPDGKLAILSALSSARGNFEIHIDWMWQNNQPPADNGCFWTPINNPIPGKATQRGASSAHSCVVSAIENGRAGHTQAAIDWLAAGQCHNPGAVQAIRAAGGAAVQYALQTYGPSVPGGPPPPAPVAEILSYHNATGMTLDIYEGLIPANGVLSCNAPGMKRVGTLANNADYRSTPAPKGSQLWVRIMEPNPTGACDSKYMRFEGKANPLP